MIAPAVALVASAVLVLSAALVGSAEPAVSPEQMVSVGRKVSAETVVEDPGALQYSAVVLVEMEVAAAAERVVVGLHCRCVRHYADHCVDLVLEHLAAASAACYSCRLLQLAIRRQR